MSNRWNKANSVFEQLAYNDLESMVTDGSAVKCDCIYDIGLMFDFPEDVTNELLNDVMELYNDDIDLILDNPKEDICK